MVWSSCPSFIDATQGPEPLACHASPWVVHRGHGKDFFFEMHNVFSGVFLVLVAHEVPTSS
jgi:hypothetical protein